MEFSFFSMISQASLVAKIVLCILVLMSVGSWGMMIQKTLALNAAYRRAPTCSRRPTACVRPCSPWAPTVRPRSISWPIRA